MGVSMINPELRRKIKIRKRPDLEINKQRYAGQNYYVVKDPVSLRYYRFREEELFLLEQFDGKNNLDDVRHEFVEKFRPQRISVAELEKFAGQLLQAGIATADTPQIGQRLYDRYQKNRGDRFKRALMNLFYIKVPVFDPEKLLSKMLPYTRFFFTIPFFLAALTGGLAALLLVLVNWQTFVAKLPSYHEFFTWRNVMYLWVVLGVVKVLHEFGHGLSCKAFGGEVHEMGFLLLVFSPALYCNVTDAWMLPNKWRRVVIGAAGMYVELILSSIFVFVWWYTEPGLLNTLSLSIIFICSVSTVMFNANPLLRFDGYYILADFLEIPNLRERSNKYLGNLASRIFFGVEAVHDPYMPKERKWFFALYAVAAYLYRWVVTFAILWFLYTFLKPYKLGTISAILGIGAAVMMFVVPLYKVIEQLRSRWRSMKVNKLRMSVMIAAALALLAAILFTPFPMRKDVPMILQPRDATPVFVEVGDVLQQLRVKDGDQVGPGAILADLSEPELEREYSRADADFNRYNNEKLAYLGAGDLSLAGEAAVRAQAAFQHRDSLKTEMAKLRVVAPPNSREGVAMSPPKPKEVGALLKAGQMFCEIGDPAKLEAYLVVEHSDVSLVHDGQRVWLKLSGHVGDIIEGKINHISLTELESIPSSLSNKYGGEVATKTDEDGKTERPMFKSYGVEVYVDNPDGTLVSGVRGVARIDIGWRSIYWRVKRYLQQTFHFRM